MLTGRAIIVIKKDVVDDVTLDKAFKDKIFEYILPFRDISDIIFPSVKTLQQAQKPYAVKVSIKLDNYILILSKDNFFQMRQVI